MTVFKFFTASLFFPSHIRDLFPNALGPVSLLDKTVPIISPELISSAAFKKASSEGESIGIVGPSGCGKSILSLACLNLLPKSASFSGNIYFFNDKKNSVFDLNSKDIYNYRGVFSSIIFQNPFSSLNPVYTCGYTLRESLIRTGKFSKKELKILKLFLISKSITP